MSVPAPERKESTAEFENTAKEIDKLALSMYGKQCYADIKDTILLDIYHLASHLLDCCVRANDIYLPTSKDLDTIRLISIPKQQERLSLFVEAKGYVASLNAKVTELYIVRPVKHKYRGTKKLWGELLNKEYKLLKGIITKEETKLKAMNQMVNS